MTTRRTEAPTGFTALLERFADTHAKLLSVAFVDSSGECVDYHTIADDPFTVKVLAAELALVSARITEGIAKIMGGALRRFSIETETRRFIVTRLSRSYLIVFAFDTPGRRLNAHVGDIGQTVDDVIDSLTDGADETNDVLLRHIEELAQRVRHEADISQPTWAMYSDFSVELRVAVGWDFAPDSFVFNGVHFSIESVLGRWEEVDASGQTLTCFRVRTSDQHEQTLFFDTKRWSLRETVAKEWLE